MDMPQTKLWHRKEETHNTVSHRTARTHSKQSNQHSLPQQDEKKNQYITKQGPYAKPQTHTHKGEIPNRE